MESWPTDTAKDTRVGGTSRSLKDPDMDDGGAQIQGEGPSRAATAYPSGWALVPSFSKYSWKDSQHFLRSPPAAMTLATDSATAR